MDKTCSTPDQEPRIEPTLKLWFKFGTKNLLTAVKSCFQVNVPGTNEIHCEYFTHIFILELAICFLKKHFFIKTESQNYIFNMDASTFAKRLTINGISRRQS